MPPGQFAITATGAFFTASARGANGAPGWVASGADQITEYCQPKEKEARTVAELTVGTREVKVMAYASWYVDNRQTGMPSVKPTIAVEGLSPGRIWTRTVEDFSETDMFGKIMVDSVLRDAMNSSGGVTINDAQERELTEAIMEARRIAVRHALGALCARVCRLLSKEEVMKAMAEAEVHEVMEE